MISVSAGMSGISGRRTLHRLIYASRQDIPAADLDHEVGAIIRVSVRNNRAVGVTGLLLVHEGWFIQALEGPAEAVMTTYGRIVDDPRHSEAKVLQAGPVEARAFAKWNMCARGISTVDDAITAALTLRDGFDPERFSGPAALRLLSAVGEIQGRSGVRAIGG